MAADKKIKERPTAGSVTHYELAGRYFSGSKKTVTRRLTRWINADPQLLERLKSVGFHAQQHYYTPKQVSVIYEFIGHPDDTNPEP